MLLLCGLCARVFCLKVGCCFGEGLVVWGRKRAVGAVWANWFGWWLAFKYLNACNCLVLLRTLCLFR
jgi:hypothetical protein